MKYFFVLLCLFLCYELSTQEPRRPFHGGKRSKGFFEQCLGELGFSSEEVTNIRNFNGATTMWKEGEEDSKNMGCLLACMYQKFVLMTGNTFVRLTLSEDENDPQENDPYDEGMKHFAQIREACKDIAEEAGDQCEVAFAFKECMETSLSTPAPLS